MFISLYQEYENQNYYTSELLLIFRRHPCLRPQCAIHSGNTLEKALNKIGREDIVNKCIFNVELVTDDVEKAVARVRLDQPGFDSLKEELGPSRNTSLRRDATMDPKMDPDYEEPDRMKDSESIEDVSITGAREKPKEHITITNGTVFNGTSTPIKDKYASDEKELGDMMADYLEHKCHTTDTMSKKSRDELDDPETKRQKAIADANKIVSDVTKEAARRAQNLADQAYTSTKAGHDSAEIDGTVERHATSAPSKQPVPAPRHSTTKPSTKPEFHLELSDASRTRKTVEQPPKPTQEAQSPSKSKIPVKVESHAPKLGDDPESVPLESSEDRIVGPQAVSRTVKYITREYTDGELTKEMVEEKRRISPNDTIQTVKADDLTETTISCRTEIAPSVEQIRRTTTTMVTSDPSIDPAKLEEFLKMDGTIETVRTVNLTSEDDALQPVTREEVVKRINQVVGTLPSEIFDFGDKFPDSSTTTIKTDKSESESVVQTVTTVRRVTTETPEIERTERVMRTVISSSGDGYGDAESALRSLQEQLTRSEIGETASWTAANEQWEAQTYSQDTSPGSGNGGGVDTFASNNNNNNNNKNDGSSRHDTHSDTDSDGSPQPRRRSPSKRRTLGSSSGSDVALHEGAELSPLEDDQESDFLQHSEPSFMETTTIEVDPVTQESVTTTARTETRTISSVGAGGTDDLRESMQKIMDTFMAEEKKDH